MSGARVTWLVFFIGITALFGGCAVAARNVLDREMAPGEKMTFCVSLVVSEHVAINEKMARFRNEPSANSARPLIDALTLHDRRERMLLYPVSSMLKSKEVIDGMLVEHNKMALDLNRVRWADLSNATVQQRLADICTEQSEHMKVEERDLLPVVNHFIKPRTKLAQILIEKWTHITSTRPLSITELVQSEHAMLDVLMAAHKPGSPITPLRSRLHAHANCEAQIFYPFVENVMGAQVASAMKHDHEKLKAKFEQMKQLTSDAQSARLMKQAAKLEKAHMEKVQELYPQLNEFLDANHALSVKLTNQYLKCQTANL